MNRRKLRFLVVKPFCLITFSFLASFPLFSQSLVLNGGFEDVNICTEYRVECAPEAWISSSNGFANYFKDPRRSYKSVNCMGIEAGHFTQDNRRSFIRTPLVCGMRAGARYRIEFFVKSFHEIYDSLGVIFTASDPLFDKEPLHFRRPSIFLSSKYDPLGFKDSLWYRVELDYTATGDERFFSFGYFARKDYMGERAHPLENRFYVFFDDVTIIPLDPAELPCSNYRERKEEIYDENERHAMLEKKIAHYKRNPPLPPTILRNEFIKVDTMVLPDILFATGKATLEMGSYSILDSFILKINSAKVDSIVIEGHTDSTGSLSFNEQLSLARANAVKNYLSPRTRVMSIFTRGLAFLRPVSENKTPSGRQKNRRVEVLLYIRD